MSSSQTQKNTQSIAVLSSEIGYMRSGIDDIKKGISDLRKDVADSYSKKGELAVVQASFQKDLDELGRRMKAIESFKDWGVKIVLGAVIITLLALIGLGT